MELKLVYRALRKISDWTVAGYYSETYIEGQENIPKDGPLIIASTHHNEIIDIATLAATIPHRRHLSFWAKSTMFANPISGAILSSSGAIPVRRNPNNSSPASGMTNPQDPSSSTSADLGRRTEVLNAALSNEGASRAALFRDTSKALAANQVVGVFPEGTSYTQASIYQRYARGQGFAEEGSNANGKGKAKAAENTRETGLRIVPVAIVYTDKARYLSRFYLIDIIKYGEPILIDSMQKNSLKKIMAQMEKQLREMTVNAPDWDTICAVAMTRRILWDDEDNISSKDWVEVSQRLVRIFEDPQESTQHVKAALTKYHALLHYAGIKHSVLLSLLPLSTTSILDIPPPNSVPGIATLFRPTISILAGLPLALIQLVLFVPPFCPLLAKCLAVPGEEESPAQFKADDTTLKRILGLFGSVYLGVLVLVKWHKLLVKGMSLWLQRLLTYHKLVLALAFTRGSDSLSTAEADVYRRHPPPARKLVKHLLQARSRACAALSTHLRMSEDKELLRFLQSKGAKI
ncbi:glycerol-3-phosphate O-acyltransferase, partial [Pholiota molesta]